MIWHVVVLYRCCVRKSNLRLPSPSPQTVTIFDLPSLDTMTATHVATATLRNSSILKANFVFPSFSFFSFLLFSSMFCPSQCFRLLPLSFLTVLSSVKFLSLCLFVFLLSTLLTNSRWESKFLTSTFLPPLVSKVDDDARQKEEVGETPFSWKKWSCGIKGGTGERKRYKKKKKNRATDNQTEVDGKQIMGESEKMNAEKLGVGRVTDEQRTKEQGRVTPGTSDFSQDTPRGAVSPGASTWMRRRQPREGAGRRGGLRLVVSRSRSRQSLLLCHLHARSCLLAYLLARLLALKRNNF